MENKNMNFNEEEDFQNLTEDTNKLLNDIFTDKPETDTPKRTYEIEKNVGESVWLDGYTSFAQQSSQGRFEIEQKEYRFDAVSGEKFPIYFVSGRWFDGRDGGAYNDEECMFYIEFR